MIRAKSYFIDANSNTNISHLSGILSHQTNDPTKSKSPPKPIPVHKLRDLHLLEPLSKLITAFHT